ncbi:ABC transporter permease subunit [Aeropyrum camini]|uniref:ABC-type transporter n=1 Tax=Aeropyrum camini SY1 = JCM 12091 TaxID=1198449 RepID=U3T8H3_9CREN|nr:ABC transporter permease subunit [Aeropyrum camini]BAN89827.1 ABC-type transporter [Aeropyrum camini SY1 = JCM 12091]
MASSTLVLGGYIAYSSANAISGEVQGRTFWILLSSPYRRGLVLISKYLVAVAAASSASASTLAALALSARVYGVEVDLARYLILYTAGTVYLASVASLGILLGAVTLSPRAPWTAAGMVIAMYFVDTLTLDTRLERLGAIALTRYHDALGIVLGGECQATTWRC